MFSLQPSQVPFCFQALQGKGSETSTQLYSDIPEKDLPHCKKCGALLRPHIVWYGEMVEHETVKRLGTVLLANTLLLMSLHCFLIVHH